MKEIDKIYTPEECEERIALITRNHGDLYQRVMSDFDNITREERAGNALLDAAATAYERRELLLDEIATGRRSSNGDAHHPV